MAANITTASRFTRISLSCDSILKHSVVCTTLQMKLPLFAIVSVPRLGAPDGWLGRSCEP